MNAPVSVSAPVLVAVIVGGGLLVVATVLALRTRAAASNFGWMVIAAFSCCILGLATALQAGESDGLRASAVQLLAVVLAAAVGILLTPRHEGETAPSQLLAPAARGIAWMALLGLPPTAGFLAKVMLYRSLLSVGWGSLTWLAMVATAIGVLPALWALSSPPPLPLKGPRAFLVFMLAAAILVLGCYPQSALFLADLAQGLTKST